MPKHVRSGTRPLRAPGIVAETLTGRTRVALRPPRTSFTLSSTLVHPLREGAPLPRPKAFRAKGLVYLGAREYYNEVVPGGAAAVRAAIADTGDRALSAFFEQHFVASGWYDILPVATISAFAARLRGIPHAQQVRENSAWLAKRDLRGVYRILVSMSSVAMVAMRLPRLSMRYFDFGARTERWSASRRWSSIASESPRRSRRGSSSRSKVSFPLRSAWRARRRSPSLMVRRAPKACTTA